MSGRFRLPSPAMLVAVLALVLAMGTSVYAVTRIGPRQLKPESVRTSKIADNAVTGGKANEATFGVVPSAAVAGTAGVALKPVAYAYVKADGSVVDANSFNVSSANVTKEQISAFCFRNLGFPFKTAQVSPEYLGEPGVSAALSFAAFDCNPAAQLEVATSIVGGFSPEPFFIWFFN